MNGDQSIVRERLVRVLTVFGRNFIVSLLSVLIALPVLFYLGGSPQLAGEQMFNSSSAVFSDEMMLGVRIGSVALTITFFFCIGRFGIPLYTKAFGTNPGILRLAVVVISPLIIIAATTIIFSFLLLGIQGDNFAQALYEYTAVTIWPFAFLPTIMGLLNGFRQPIPGAAQLPKEVENAFKSVESGLEKLPTLIDRAAGILDPAMKGNYVTAVFSAMSVSSLATAGISDNPVTFALLFVMPVAIAAGSCISYLLLGELKTIITGIGSPSRLQRSKFGMFAALLLPGLALASSLCIAIISYFVDIVYTDSAISLSDLLRGLAEDPKQGLAYAIVLLIPLYWIVYYLCRWKESVAAVEQVVAADSQAATRPGSG